MFAQAEDVRSARIAVAALFFVNGVALANWVPRIPAVKAALGLNDAALGMALLGTGLGALFGSLAAGALVARLGSRRTVLWAAVLLGATLVLPTLARSWAGLAAGLVAVGAADAAMDVAMNAHGVVVERRYGRSILNGFHGWWSLGAVTGGAAGSLASGLGIGAGAHLAAAGLVVALAALAAGRRLLPASADRGGAAGRAVVLPARAVGAIGLVTLLAAFVEDAPGSWSGVYLTEDLGAGAGLAGAGYIASTGAMTFARLTGDRVVDRFGPTVTARAGALLVAAGVTGGLLLPGVAGAVGGFALLGLGIGAVFPLAFRAAGRLPGQPAGTAIAMVSLIARVGFLVAPPLVGALAELASLRLALGTVAVAALVLAGLAGRLDP